MEYPQTVSVPNMLNITVWEEEGQRALMRQEVPKEEAEGVFVVLKHQNKTTLFPSSVICFSFPSCVSFRSKGPCQGLGKLRYP